MSKNLKIEQVNYNREQFNKVVKEWLDLSNSDTSSCML